jgi:hypothetical protein
MKKDMLLAPNGKPSNLTAEQYKLVRTPAFKKWFGDWENSPETASKVVDINGEPMVVWRGESKDFNVFEYKKLGSTLKTAWRNAGFYFSPTKQGAEQYMYFYQRGVLKQFFLNIKNTYTLDSKEFFDIMDWGSLPTQRFKTNKSATDFAIKRISEIKSANYDGAFVTILENNNVLEIIAFEPEQIKLADGSNTTFDGNNPDIRFEDGGTIKYPQQIKVKGFGVISKEQLIKNGSNSLDKAYERYIPINKIEGLDPEPADWTDKAGNVFQYKEGQEIDSPIEVIYDSSDDIYYLQNGNHRLKQANINNQKHILAYIQPDRGKIGNAFSVNPDIRFAKGGKIKNALKEVESAKSVKYWMQPEFPAESYDYPQKGKPNSFVKMYEEKYNADTILAYDKKGDIVGLFTISKGGDEKGAFKIVVREDSENMGWGKMLLDEAEKQGIDVIGNIKHNSFSHSGRNLLRSWLNKKMEQGGEITLLKNKVKAPKLGKLYGQDVEPTGYFAIEKKTDIFDSNPNYETKKVRFFNPLYVEVDEDTLISWKTELSKKYKAKGKKLTEKLINAGYDIIITRYSNGDTGEIIVLKTDILNMEQGGELAMGIKSEMEHKGTIDKFKRAGVSDKDVATSIAKDHLKEDPKYYTKLMKIENKLALGGALLERKFDVGGNVEEQIQANIRERDSYLENVDKLNLIHKSKYANRDIESPKSDDEKASESEIRNLLSQATNLNDTNRKLRQQSTYSSFNDEFIDQIIDNIKDEILDDWQGSLIKERSTKNAIWREISNIKGLKEENMINLRDAVYEKMYNQKNTMEIEEKTHHGISLNVGDYKNPYEVNRAIEKLLNEKGSEQESYTPDEINFLSYYSGYGGLEKQGTFSDDELKGLLYEYFTPDEIVKKMWGLAYKYGYGSIGDNSVFEPSVGVGAFLKYAPDNVFVAANEINRYSAMICHILYPNVKTILMPFEKNFISSNMSVKKNFQNLKQYSLVIGNPPYGKLGGKFMPMGEDKYSGASNWAEYFLFRGLDLLQKGGLLIYIIGAEQYNGGSLFLDAALTTTKKAIFEKADLIDAYRLPNKIFERTGVSSEIVIFRKR